jgi:hypothetical protein
MDDLISEPTYADVLREFAPSLSSRTPLIGYLNLALRKHRAHNDQGGPDVIE